jgi:siroheme synthase-like protein
VDDAQKCSFVFPALCTSDDVTVGISTSGKSPLFAKFLRKRIESIFDEELERTERILAEKRPEIKRDFDTADKRKEVAQALLDLCIERGGAPDENEINTLLGSFKEQNENKNRNKEIGACAGTD